MNTAWIKAKATRAIVTAATPLLWMDRHSPRLDRITHKPLTDVQAVNIQRLCHAGGRKFGAYYHWQLRLFEQAQAIRALDGRDIMVMTRRHDHTDYTPLHAALQDPRGALIAIPHHGLFIQGITAICMRLKGQRNVFVFYEDPKEHVTNAIFDVMYEKVYGAQDSGVGILHNTRAGLVRALKELRSGSVVIILPDVFKRAEDTYRIPFCGVQRDIMLGTATLARRGNARILPVAAQPIGQHLHFATRFGEPVEVMQSDGTPEGDLHVDYNATQRMYRAFEPLMQNDLIYWQYAHNHKQPATRDEHASEGLHPAWMLDDPYLSTTTPKPIQI